MEEHQAARLMTGLNDFAARLQGKFFLLGRRVFWFP